MTFTRVSDAETLTPLLVFGPYENERTVRTAVVPLAESANVRIVYNHVGLRTGEFMLLFDSYWDALVGSDFFTARSTYNFDGPTIPGGYEIVDGMVVYTAEVDSTFDLRFVVHGSGIRIVQNDPKWELRIPFHELVEEA